MTTENRDEGYIRYCPIAKVLCDEGKVGGVMCAFWGVRYKRDLTEMTWKPVKEMCLLVSMVEKLSS